MTILRPLDSSTTHYPHPPLFSTFFKSLAYCVALSYPCFPYRKNRSPERFIRRRSSATRGTMWLENLIYLVRKTWRVRLLRHLNTERRSNNNGIKQWKPEVDLHTRECILVHGPRGLWLDEFVDLFTNTIHKLGAQDLIVLCSIYRQYFGDLPDMVVFEGIFINQNTNVVSSRPLRIIEIQSSVFDRRNVHDDNLRERSTCLVRFDGCNRLIKS